jgi:fructoselysine-6-P-deglycase FrlB-like protein
MEQMIAVEPGLVSSILSDSVARAIADLVRTAYQEGSPIVTTGCGTSEHGALAIGVLLETALHKLERGTSRVEVRQAFDALLEPRAGGVLIAVSHEGSTAATIGALRTARANGARTVLFTAKRDAPASRLADHLFITPLLDRSWCHTVAYVSAILAGAAVAGALCNEMLDADLLGGFLEATSQLTPDHMGSALAHCSRLIVTGRGPDLVSARELALKIEEGTRLPATAIQLETLLHGHFGAIDQHTGVIFLLCAPEGDRRRDRRARFAAEALRRIGARCGAILGGQPDFPETLADAGCVTLPDYPAAQGPVQSLASVLTASAIALQKLTVALAHERGCNPDLIRREEEPYRDAASIAEKGFS